MLTKLQSMDYMISCIETAPTTGHEHMHVYAHFNRTHRLSQKILKLGCHIEVCKGTPKQNIAYIRKGGQIVDEIGTEPHQGMRTIKELREASIDDVDPHLWRIKKQIDAEYHDKEVFFGMLNEIRSKSLKAPKIVYITGGPGKGKTYTAYDYAARLYPDNNDIGKLTLNNDFIDIVNNDAKCYVIEEFRTYQISAANFLQLTDKYGYRCNIKGGFATLRPEMIIICSIVPPEKIYRDEANKQFLRRITERIDLGPEEEVDERERLNQELMDGL